MNDTVPPSLTRFGAELERAIARELTSSAPQPTVGRRSRRRLAMTAAAGCAIAGAAAYAIVSATGPSTTHTSPWAQMVLRRVGAVATPTSPNTILHVAGSETLSPGAQHGSATHVSSLTAEQWSQQGPPWRSVMILHDAGGPVLRESNGRVYDTQNNVLYVPPSLPGTSPKYTIKPGSKAGTYTIVFATKHGPVSQPISTSDIRALRDGDEQTSWAETWNGHRAQLVPMIVPSSEQAAKLSAQQPSGASASFATDLRRLLKSGHVRVVRTTTADGHPAIEISSVHPQSGPQTTYYVGPHSYKPIEVDTYGWNNPADVTRIHFRTYQLLPLKGNEHLLEFSVPKSATIDRNPADAFRHMGLPPFW